MTKESQLIKYLGEARLMQVATVSGDQPWVCTVYFVVDDQQNLYWLSLPSRRHSQEIAQHDKVAVAIAVKTDWPVIGVQAQGRAFLVEDHPVIEKIMQSYVEKYKSGQEFYENVVKGINQHRLYCFKPEKFVLFDEVNFKEIGRQEWVA